MPSITENPAQPDAEADPASRQAGPRGAIDNIGAERIYGWAWNPERPEERVTVEVRLAGRTVLSTRADMERADLPQSGIGDGRHAFALRLNAECVARRAEMSVVARAEDGRETVLPFRVRRTPEMAAQEAKRAVENLAEGQRELREVVRTMQADRARVAEATLIGTRVLEAETRLEARLATLEIWLTRLDERLATLAPEGSAPRKKRRIDPWQAVLMAVLAAVAGGGLVLGAVAAAGHDMLRSGVASILGVAG